MKQNGQDSIIDQHIDTVLRAAGTSLRNYSMHKTREALRAAMREVLRAAAESERNNKEEGK